MNKTPSVADVLDLCIEQSRTGGNPEEILRHHPGVADEVRPLLALAGKLDTLPAPSPATTAATGIFAALSRENANRRRERDRSRFFSGTVLCRAAAALAFMLFIGWGAIAASNHTIPGDLLYPVKLFTEHVRFLLAVNAEEQVELRIVFSEKRLTEAVRKYQRGGGIDRELLRAMLDESEKALGASQSIAKPGRGLVVSKIAYMSNFQKRILERLKAWVEPEQRARLEPFVRACDSRCERMCEILGCGRGEETASPAAGEQGICTCPRCPAAPTETLEGGEGGTGPCHR